MEIADGIFKRKSYSKDKLLSYGFKQDGGVFTYSAPISDGQFELVVRISENAISTDVLETPSGEPYTLYHVDGADGAFVGQIRSEAEAVLLGIAEKCFYSEIFKCEQTKTVIDYALQAFASPAEYLWEKFPDNAVLRRGDNRKWYAAILTVKRAAIGLDGDGTVEIIDLREEPEVISSLVDGKTYFGGYHMNKTHWYTVCLDGAIPDGELKARLDKSYALAKKSK